MDKRGGKPIDESRAKSDCKNQCFPKSNLKSLQKMNGAKTILRFAAGMFGGSPRSFDPARKVHDLLFSRLLAAELSGHASLAHNDNAIADAQYLRKLR